MTATKPTRPILRPAIAGLTVAAALLFAAAPAASAHQRHQGAPGHLPGHATSDHHQARPGHAGHVGAPG
jgi:hypothetical protein